MDVIQAYRIPCSSSEVRSYELDDRGSTPDRNRRGVISLRHRVDIGSGAHPASNPPRTDGSFTVVKAAGPWSWPFVLWCHG